MKNDRIVDILYRVSRVIIVHADELSELDRKIGDGDHGLNLKRGFEAVIHNLDKMSNKDREDSDISQLLNQSAMVILSNVGGASGPLYATAMMRMAKVFKDKKEEEIDAELIGKAVSEAVEGIKQRGAALTGDKTMVDTIEPFYIGFKRGLETKSNLKDSFNEGLIEAKKGMEFTKDIRAKKGRASYLGDRSIGVIDPGAYSSYLILRTIYNEI